MSVRFSSAVMAMN